MYVINPDSIPKEKLSYANGVLAHWLIYSAHIPLFSRKGKQYVFAKTKLLDDALANVPFWLKVAGVF